MSLLEINEKNIDKDFPGVRLKKSDFTDKKVRIRSSIRCKIGKVYGADEWAEKEARILHTPLP